MTDKDKASSEVEGAILTSITPDWAYVLTRAAQFVVAGAGLSIGKTPSEAEERQTSELIAHGLYLRYMMTFANRGDVVKARQDFLEVFDGLVREGEVSIVDRFQQMLEKIGVTLTNPLRN